MRMGVEIKNHSGYYITPRGHVYSPRGKLKLKLNSAGYYRVTLYGKVKERLLVHRLVAEAYIPNPGNLPVVMHLDNDKTNNRVSNLKWGTQSDNLCQAQGEGRIKTSYQPGVGNGLKGDSAPQTKVSVKDRKNICKLYSTGNYTFKRLGTMYGVSRVAISNIVKHKTFS